MRLTDIIKFDNALNITAIVVILVVGSLSTFIVFNQGISWLMVGGLSLAHLVTFGVFISPWAAQSNTRLRSVLWVEAGIIAVLYLLVDSDFIAILSIVWIVQATELYPPDMARRLLAIAVLTFTASRVFHSYPDDLLSPIISSITLALFHLFAFIATLRTIREQDLREQTAALNRELIATRELLSQSTRQSERVRIARELHDLLGHHMTALILNLEVAAHRCEGEAREKVEQSQSLARLLLGDLRTAVSELREDDSINLEQAVNKMIADIPGLRFEVDFSGAPQIKDVEQAETLLRCIQESVTNVMRHSNADTCQIKLTETKGSYTLTIGDNGKAVPAVNPGNGLKGMDERVTARGGKLTWQQQGGFSLQIQLPMAGNP